MRIPSQDFCSDWLLRARDTSIFRQWIKKVEQQQKNQSTACGYRLIFENTLVIYGNTDYVRSNMGHRKAIEGNAISLDSQMF